MLNNVICAIDALGSATSTAENSMPAFPEENKDLVICARVHEHGPSNARANASLSREDRGDVRRVQGRTRIEARHI